MSCLTLGGIVSSFYNQIYCISSLILLITHATEASFPKAGFSLPKSYTTGSAMWKSKGIPLVGLTVPLIQAGRG